MTTPQIDDGGAAFPEVSDQNLSEGSDNYGAIYTTGGLTKREHFAGLAISEQFKFAVSRDEMEQSARRCFAIADTMIAAGKAQP